jgi:hypothetical protein
MGSKGGRAGIPVVEEGRAVDGELEGIELVDGRGWVDVGEGVTGVGRVRGAGLAKGELAPVLSGGVRGEELGGAGGLTNEGSCFRSGLVSGVGCRVGRVLAARPFLRLVTVVKNDCCDLLFSVSGTGADDERR